MAKYKIVVEFETPDPLPEQMLNEVTLVCAVQVEALAEGELNSSEEFGPKTFSNHRSRWEEVT